MLMEKNFRERLRLAAHDDLTAFAEYINPDEVPAFHHRYLCNKLMDAEAGNLMRLGISMPPGTAKPVAENSLVKIENGTYVEIKDITVGDRVLTHTGKYQTVLGKHSQGILPSLLIQTASGRNLITAYDHPFLTPSGWKEAKDLSISESLAAIIPQNTSDTSKRSIEEFRVIGYLLGDGCVTSIKPSDPNCTDYHFNLTNVDPWIIKDFCHCITVLGFSFKISIKNGGSRIRVTSSKAHAWMRLSGIAGLNSHTKHFPEWVFKGSLEKQAALVGAYFNCDSTTHKNGSTRKSLGVEYNSVSFKLLSDSQKVLQTLGVRATLENKISKYEGERHYSYRLSIVGDSVRQFIDIVGMCESKKNRCLEWNPQRKRFYTNIIEDSITLINPHIDTKMYCLTVENDSSFTIDHIAVHNSSYCSRMFPAWYLGRNPKKKFIQAGHTQNFVESQFGKKTRDIVDLQEFRDIFPNIRVANDSRASGLWSLNNPYGGYTAKGVGQAIAGFRGNISVVDDPIGSRADAESQTVRDAVFNWFSADLSTRLVPDSPLLIVATRWHSDDLMGRVEKMSDEGKGIPYEIINIPALCIDAETDPLNRAENEHIWPERSGIDYFLQFRAVSSARDWQSLFQGQPIDQTGSVMKSEWFKRYINDPRKEFPEGRITISVDTASKPGERNDYTVVTVWLKTTTGNYYLLDVQREKLEFTEMTLMIEKTCRRWAATAILVEDKGSGTQYIQTRQGKAPAPIISIAVNQTGKEFRFDAVTPMFEAGLVYLPNTASWLPDYEAELISFPLGKHDDQVDSTSQYLSWAAGKKSFGGMSKITNANNGKGTMNARAAMAEAALQKLMAERATAAAKMSHS